MNTYIALLRAVNLGGHNKISMAGLRGWAESLGLANVRTVLQSGNLVFQAAGTAAGALEGRLEAEAAKGLGLTTDFMVRGAAEWERIVAENPFAEMAVTDPGHLVVVCLKSVPGVAAVTALLGSLVGPEEVHVTGREAYITYPAGIGESKLTAAVIDRKLGTRGTARNWNTVLKLAALARV